jgi:DNA-binding transcriptional LysR family regulator
MIDWNDFRIFISVARHGSSAAAARALGISQSSVSRRIGCLEAQVGLQLFDKDRKGFRLTDVGATLLEASEDAISVFTQLESRIESLRRQATQRIRITGAWGAMAHWMSPIMEAYRARHPAAQFEIDTSERQLSLEAGEADIALRATDAIDSETIVARRVGRVPWAIYGSTAYAREHGTPTDFTQARQHRFVFYDEALSERIEPIRAMAAHLHPEQIVMRVNSVPGMVSMLRAGSGYGLLPSVVAQDAPDLTHCWGDPSLMHNLWLACTRQAYERDIVRDFMRFAGDALSSHDFALPYRTP